jgi:hypothetical protein
MEDRMQQIAREMGRAIFEQVASMHITTPLWHWDIDDTSMNLATDAEVNKLLRRFGYELRR